MLALSALRLLLLLWVFFCLCFAPGPPPPSSCACVHREILKLTALQSARLVRLTTLVNMTETDAAAAAQTAQGTLLCRVCNWVGGCCSGVSGFDEAVRVLVHILK